MSDDNTTNTAGGETQAGADTSADTQAGTGNDSVAGGAGADAIAGGAGNDEPQAGDKPKRAAKPKEPKLDEPQADPTANDVPKGMARVKHPAGATSCSHGGETYEADAEGFILVPLIAVEHLTDHGFELVGA